jgi:putative ABC transport system permease protein
MLSDVRYAIRTLTARPGFAIAAVLTLALGIGANTSIFTIVYGVLLKPLPYYEPDRLVRLSEGRPGFMLNVSYPNFVDWRARNHVFDDLAVYNAYSAVVIAGDPGPAEVFQSATCEAQLFQVLGLSPSRGRLLVETDEQPAMPPVAVISDQLWQRRFSADPAIVGRPITMDGDLVTVVGILPADVRFENVDVWFPMRRLGPTQLDRANHPGFRVVARLREELDLQSAQREMSAIASELEREYPSSNHQMGVFVTPLLDSIAGDIRPTLLALSGAVSVLLLIACANVANLLLARSLGRERERSIRAALGASRLRLMRLFLAEGLALGIAGATAGLLLAAWGVRALHSVPGLPLPRVSDIAIDPHVVGFALTLAVGTAVLFALAPASQLSRLDLMHVLRVSTAGDAPTPRTTKLRSIVLAAEVSLLVVLLAGATLMQRTLAFLAGIDPGFNADRVLAVRMVQIQSPTASEETSRTFTRQLLSSVGAIGGVGGAAVAWPFDYTGFSWSPNINLPDRPFPAGQEPAAQAATVTPGYFAAMGIPLVRGRNFGDQDRQGTPVVVIVNQSFVRRFYSNEDPIGQRVTAVRISEMQNMPIVGVVGDTRRGGVLGGFTPEIYVPYDQFPQSHATLVVRAANGDPLRFTSQVKAAIGSVDRTVAIRGMRRVSDQLAATYGDRRVVVAAVALCCLSTRFDDRGHRKRGVVLRRAANVRDRHSDGTRREA